MNQAASLANVRAIHEARDGALWIGTIKGLLVLDSERKQFVRYLKNPASSLSLHDDDILCLFEDSEGNIWVGTQSGVSRLNPKPSFTNRLHDPGDPHGLVHNNIRAVQVDSRGSIWVGTRRGLQRLDPKTGRFTTYQHDPRDPTASPTTTLRSSGKIAPAHSGLAPAAEDSTGSIAQQDVSSPIATSRTTLPA